MSVIKVSYEGRGQKRKRDDSRARQGAARGRGSGRGSGGGRGSEREVQWGKEWPGGSNKYCRFALGKSNMDTQVSLLCVSMQSIHGAHTRLHSCKDAQNRLLWMGKTCLARA